MVYLILAIIAAVLIISATTLIIIDKVDITKKFNEVEPGMTGKAIQDQTHRKLQIVNVNRDGSYEAVLRSRFRLYKFKLYFKNGKYERRERITK